VIPFRLLQIIIVRGEIFEGLIAPWSIENFECSKSEPHTAEPEASKINTLFRIQPHLACFISDRIRPTEPNFDL
jgi:hypothetical protein